MLEKVWRKQTFSYAVGGNVYWYSHYGEEYGGFLKVKVKSLSRVQLFATPFRGKNTGVGCHFLLQK